MSKDRDPNFDGSYETSKFAERSLEEDILLAGQGEVTGETSTGGAFRQTDDRIDVWGKGEPGNYSHSYYNNVTGEYGTREGKR